MMYDGFISYSHAADGLLAPRLQSALQRFAKPWWKRRAVRIFRDESSLSANPHLWSSITEALDTSGWFVLLLSPDAARSEWVNQEIAYWVENRDPNKILPVVTGGTFGWANGEATGDAVPDALRGVFSEEPRWVDVRWAKDEDQLDLQDPRFADAVADIASTIRGIPKDDLASEEVRQHRRTVRTAWAAGVVTAVLAVAAVGFGVQSAQNADEAERQAAIAQQNADEAAANAAAAESSAQAEAAARQAAEENAQEALRNASVAQSSNLAAAAANEVDADPELATLLALEALNVAESASVPAAVDALPTLRRASEANRLVHRIDFGAGLVATDFVSDGSAVIVMSDVDRSVSRYSVEDLSEPSWAYRDPTTHDLFREVAVSPDGQTVALIVTNDRSEAEEGPEVALDEEGSDGLPARVVLLDATTGGLLGTIPLDPCIEPAPRQATDSNRSGWSPDGSVFALLIEETTCAEAGTLLLDPVGWSELARFDRAGEVSFTGDGDRILVFYPFEGAELLAFPSLDVLRSYDFDIRPVPPRHAAISRDGSTIYFHNDPIEETRPGFWDAEEDRFLGWAAKWEGLAQGVRFGDDGRALVMGADSDGLYDTRTGLPFARFHTSGTISAAFNSDAELVATGSRGGLFELWSVRSGAGTPIEPEDSTLAWVNPNWIVSEDPIGIFALTIPDELPYDAPPDYEPFEYGVILVDPETGAVQASRQFIVEAQALADGRFVSLGLIAPNEDFETFGPLGIWNPADGSLEVVQDCVAGRADYFPAGFVCPDGRLLPDGLVVSYDRTRYATIASDPAAAPADAVDFGDITSKVVAIWDPETGEQENEVRVEEVRNASLAAFGPSWIILAEQPNAYWVVDLETGDVVADLRGAWRFGTTQMSTDGSRFYAAQTSGQLTEFDTTTWEPVRTWQAQEGRPRGIALSPDGTRLAVSGEDGLIVIWGIDGDDPVVVDRIPAAANRISDIVWMDDQRMGAVLVRDFFQVEWQVVDLDQQDVARDAASKLVRSFTQEECQLYRVDPCPTLDEIRSR